MYLNIFNTYIVQYLAYNDSVFYIANHEEIKLFPIVDDLSFGEKYEVIPDRSEIFSI